MPAGIDNPILGYLSFTAVKFCGYTLFAKHINHHVTAKRNIYAVGTARTAIGMLFGAAYWFLLSYLFDITDTTTPIAYFGGLIVLRYVEWYILLRLFYNELFAQKRQNSFIIKGIFLSYILDLPAATGFFITAGLWIC
jgi:hypothetical protein